MMANVITKEHAEAIARKLGAKTVSGKMKSGGSREHEAAVIYYDGVEIASFGIRRGSNKEAPHGHLTEDLHVSPNECRQLADCPMSFDQWLEVMRKKNLLPQSQQETPQANQARPIIRRHGPRRQKRNN
jgi:hypothetical protein